MGWIDRLYDAARNNTPLADSEPDWVKAHLPSVKAIVAGTPQPRTEWPIDTAALITRHRECAAMAIRWAGDHAKKAIALSEGVCQ
jgi:hypothetical protein